MADLLAPLDLSHGGSSEPKVSILLVDDRRDNLLALRAILENLGPNLVEARSGAEALERLRSDEFAVVLLDVFMPGISGFETAKLIRADDRSRHTPIIFLTADDIKRAQMEEGYALGAVDFLVKPLLPFILQAKVRGFIDLFQDKLRARREAEQLRLLVNGTADYAIFMLDPQGHIVTWNAGAERLKGYAAEEIIGQHFSRFYPPDALERGWPQHELEVARTEGRFEDEGWRVRKDGSCFWANVVITALRDDQHNLRGFSKITRDLTARKQAEEALRRSEEGFRRLVEGAKDYAIFLLDTEGNIVSWNPGAERIKGYKAEEIIGQHFSKFYPQEAIDRGWPAHELKVARAEGRFEDEGWRVRKDGTQFWANVVITALHDDAGKFVGYSKITRDMTDRKLAEQSARRLVEETTARRVAEENAGRIQEQRERLRVTLASIGDGVISTDAEGRVDFLNPVAEELVGWKSEEAARSNLEEVFRIVNEATRQPVENPALRALREGVIVGLVNHTVLIARDGRERPIDDSAAPIRDAGGGVIGSVLVFRDISARKQSEAALNERVRLLTLNAAIGTVLVQADHLRPMLQRCAQTLVDHLHGAFARIWTLSPQGDVLELQASAGLYTHLDGPHSRVPLGQYKIGRIAQERRPHLTNAVAVDPRVSDQEWAQREGMVAFAGYPLLVDDRLVGVMAMFARQPLTGATVEAMASVANGIAVGIERKAAEEERRRSEQELADFFENATVGLHWVGPDGTILRANRAELEMLGYSRQEYIGRPIADFHADREVIDDILQRLKQGEKLNECPARLRCKDGSIKDVLIDSSALFRHGHFVHTRCFTRDITKRKRAEAEVREQERRWRNLAEALPNLVWTALPDGQSDYLSSQWGVYTGIPEQELLGLAWLERVVHPDDRERTLASWQRAVADQGVYDLEYRIRRQDGEYRWFKARGVPIRDEQGRIVKWFGTCTDIEDAKQAEEELRQSEERFAQFMQHLPGLAWVKDAQGRYAYANDAAVKAFRLSRNDLYGKTDAEIFPAQTAVQFQENDERALASGAGVQVVETLERDDGIVHSSIVSKFPIPGRDGRPGVLGGVAIDITDLKRAEEALRETDRRKDEFLATLAHELRNPLAPIRNSLQILKMPRLDAATVERTREMMERQVHQLVRLVDDLLDVSRVMRGKIELRTERVELATVVARAVETAQPLIEAQEHELTVSLPPESLSLDADPVRLAQVVGNLLMNAAKYTEANGRIWLTARREGDMAVLRLRDSGIGIAPDMLPRVFELFVQADHTSTKAQGGLGIGLTLVKNLVEMHHGTVEAHSAGLGAGCEFVVRLPLIPNEEQQRIEEENSAASQEPACSPGQRLLVVDDNVDAADSLAMLLRLQGHEVRVAHDGPTALEMVKGYRPALVFLDIGMPQMDGYEVARRLRRQPGLENVGLAALTGWGQQEDRRRTAEAGFDHHLVKPVEPAALEKLLGGLPNPL
jgi:PAS domain S-box-containing protein